MRYCGTGKDKNDIDLKLAEKLLHLPWTSRLETIILNVVNLGIAIGSYYPFFKIFEREQLTIEAKADAEAYPANRKDLIFWVLTLNWTRLKTKHVFTI